MSKNSWLFEISYVSVLVISSIIYAAYGRRHSKRAKKHALMEKQNESMVEMNKSCL